MYLWALFLLFLLPNEMFIIVFINAYVWYILYILLTKAVTGEDPPHRKQSIQLVKIMGGVKNTSRKSGDWTRQEHLLGLSQVARQWRDQGWCQNCSQAD